MSQGVRAGFRAASWEFKACHSGFLVQVITGEGLSGRVSAVDLFALMRFKVEGAILHAAKPATCLDRPEGFLKP